MPWSITALCALAAVAVWQLTHRPAFPAPVVRMRVEPPGTVLIR